MPTLTSPLVLRSGLVLPNRLAKSAMTESLADRQRRPSGEIHRLYRAWATSGAGLLITGNVGIDADHPVRPRDIILRAHSELSPFAEWAEICKSAGARAVMQLNHGGRQTMRLVNPRPLGPSTGAAVKIMRSFGEPVAATSDEIDEIVRRFGEAAELAERAGFDGVQVHAAHGYLLNQFLSPDVNRRDDAWGGDVPRRARLLLECVRAVRAATSPGFTVLVKLNAGDFLSGGFSEDESLEVVSLLDREAIDLIEISGGRYESGASFGHHRPNSGAREAYFASFTRRAREATAVPLLLTGGLRSRGAMQAALDEGAADVIGIARPMAVYPDYPRRVLAGEELPEVRAPKLGVAALDGAAELAWWSLQLARIARGQAPDVDASALVSLASYLAGDAWDALAMRALARLGRRQPQLAECTGDAAALRS